MATVTETPTTNGVANGTANTTFVQRVTAIPVVSDAIQKGYSIVQSNSYSAAAYDRAEGLATTLYKSTEPIAAKLQPQIQQIDGALNKGLDFVQSRYPFPFEAKTDDIVAKARAPADQAYSVASVYAGEVQARVSPIAQQVQTQLNKTLETIRPLQEKLQANLTALAGPPSQAVAGVTEKVQAASNSLVSEVEGLITYLKTQSQELPAHAQTSLQPVLDRLAHGYTDVKTEFSKPDVPLSTKATNVLNYTRDNATPLIQDAIQAVKDLLSKSGKIAEEKTDAATTAVEEKAGEVKATAEEVKAEGSAKVNGA